MAILEIFFIRHSQNMQRHNTKDEYKPHGGRRRKHWIETPISKLFSIHLFLNRLYT